MHAKLAVAFALLSVLFAAPATRAALIFESTPPRTGPEGYS
jgi:hypothetical protein